MIPFDTRISRERDGKTYTVGSDTRHVTRHKTPMRVETIMNCRVSLQRTGITTPYGFTIVFPTQVLLRTVQRAPYAPTLTDLGTVGSFSPHRCQAQSVLVTVTTPFSDRYTYHIRLQLEPCLALACLSRRRCLGGLLSARRMDAWPWRARSSQRRTARCPPLT